MQAVNQSGQVVTLRGGDLLGWGEDFLRSLTGHDQHRLAELIEWMNGAGVSPERYWSLASRGRWEAITEIFRRRMGPRNVRTVDRGR